MSLLRKILLGLMAFSLFLAILIWLAWPKMEFRLIRQELSRAEDCKALNVPMYLYPKVEKDPARVTVAGTEMTVGDKVKTELPPDVRATLWLMELNERDAIFLYHYLPDKSWRFAPISCRMVFDVDG
ncbi:MAG: hypothetical protein KDE34_13190 [Anaerolineales bacterium]|nr:hypothetical protein [Anaerolineales bacterium]MCB8961465.1 hypothetical protein [Ardenticatenales bacterium]